MMSLALLATACNSLTTRDEAAKSQAGKKPEQPAPMPSPSPVPSAPISVTPPAPPPQPTPLQPPTFLNRELPKVGVILGAGGMKTYAQLGVLREFTRARIPIHAIVGLEWGAVIGSVYAMQGQINDAEWKAFKLREEDLPGEGGFLSTRIKPQSISRLSEFFDNVYGAATIERTRVDFACPAYWQNVDRSGFMTKGPIKEALRACLPYFPFFHDAGGVMASPFSVEEAAAHLRSRGATLIVLVNVLGQGEFFSSKALQEQASENLLWSEIRREMLRARSPLVHLTININTSGHPLADTAGRRALIELGSKASTEAISKLATQYGF